MSNPDLKTPTLTERQEFENNMNPADIQNEHFYDLPKKTQDGMGYQNPIRR